MIGASKTVYDSSEIERYVQEGMSISDMSAELGVSYNAVRSILSRRGLKARPEHERTVRDFVADMRPIEAVEYLLGVIEQIDAIKPRDTHPVDQIGVNLTKFERRLMVALYDAKAALSRDALYTAIYFDRVDADSLPSEKVIDVYVCKIRSKLPDSFLIINHHGFGYSLEAHA